MPPTNWLLPPATLLFCLLCVPNVEAGEPTQDGFVPLLNGRDLSNWQTTGKWYFDDDGLLTLTPKQVRFRLFAYTHFLWTQREYGDFVLDLEYKIEAGGNSGVFVRCRPPRSYIEVQIADSYGKRGELEDGDSGGIVESVAPSKMMAKPAGQWNHLTITCQQTMMQVVLNGETVIDLDLEETSKKGNPRTGHIGLQDYGFPVWFRNVRIKELK